MEMEPGPSNPVDVKYKIEDVMYQFRLKKCKVVIQPLPYVYDDDNEESLPVTTFLEVEIKSEPFELTETQVGQMMTYLDTDAKGGVVVKMEDSDYVRRGSDSDRKELNLVSTSGLPARIKWEPMSPSASTWEFSVQASSVNNMDMNHDDHPFGSNAEDWTQVTHHCDDCATGGRVVTELQYSWSQFRPGREKLLNQEIEEPLSAVPIIVPYYLTKLYTLVRMTSKARDRFSGLQVPKAKRRNKTGDPRKNWRGYFRRPSSFPNKKAFENKLSSINDGWEMVAMLVEFNRETKIKIVRHPMKRNYNHTDVLLLVKAHKAMYFISPKPRNPIDKKRRNENRMSINHKVASIVRKKLIGAEGFVCNSSFQTITDVGTRCLQAVLRNSTLMKELPTTSNAVGVPDPVITLRLRKNAEEKSSIELQHHFGSVFIKHHENYCEDYFRTNR